MLPPVPNNPMDSVKKIGAVLGSHYEKLILSVILLALLAAAGFLPFRVSQNRQTIQDAIDLPKKKAKKEMQAVDTSTVDDILKREKSAPILSLSGQHNLFNPLVWKKGKDGLLYKVGGEEDGPGGLIVNAVRPLYLTIEFEGAMTSGDNIRYRFRVLDEAKAPKGAKARQVSAALNQAKKDDPFVVTKVVEGTPEDPTSVEFRFSDSNETVKLAKGAVFKRLSGYEGDLLHSKLGAKFPNVRQKQENKQPQVIRLGSHAYNIVAITKDAVTVESSTSKKRWTVRLKGAS